MTNTKHALFAPSGMNRIVACPGYLNLRQAAGDLVLNEDDTPQSKGGTAAHWVCSEALQGRWPAVDSLAPNGIAVTDEMLDCAEIYVDALTPYLDEHAQIETLVECPSIHPECYGTPDFANGPANGRLVVADYKFGHKYVDVFENWQLLAYAAGRMPELLPTVDVVLIIIQPRSYHREGPVRTWTLKGHELFNYASRLSKSCEMALLPAATCFVSSACYECPVRHVCETALRAEQAAFDLAGSTVPLTLSPDAKALRLKQIRRAMEHLKQMESGVAEDIMNEIRAGHSVPGFELKASAGRERWTVSVDEVITLGEALGIDVSKPGAITPNQARKAGLPADVVAGYSERSSGELKVVEADAGKLARVFKKEV